jgi:hypothetical protein
MPFWAVTLYDPQTYSQLQTGQSMPSVGSQTGGIRKNGDGSLDVYIGPKAPRGYKNNWLKPSQAKAGLPFFACTGRNIHGLIRNGAPVKSIW